MAVNGSSHSTAIETRSTPQGSPDTPYVIPFLGGENIYIPCSKSATRLLVTGKETNNGFAIVGSGGVAAAPIGFHYHREAHDVFLCLKGSVNVWAGEKCRTMTPGDFASVPPVCFKVIFLYFLSLHTCLRVKRYSLTMSSAHNPPIPNPRPVLRVPWPHRPRWLGGVLPLHRRALLRAALPTRRRPQPIRSPHPQTQARRPRV